MRAPFTDLQRDQLRQHAEGLRFFAKFHPGDWPTVSANLRPGKWLMLAVREMIHGQPGERMYLFASRKPHLVVSQELTADAATERFGELLGRATLAQTSR